MPLASAIVFKDLPESIDKQIGEVKRVFDIAKTVKVYEIARDPWIERAYKYATLRELVRDAKGLRRSQYIYELDPNDKQKEVLESLEDELSIEKKKYTDKEEELFELKKKMQELTIQKNALEDKLKHQIGPEMKQYESQVEEYRRKVEDIETDLASERRKSYEYSIQNNELQTTLVDNKFLIEALEAKLDKSEQIAEDLRIEIGKRDREIREYTVRMRQLLSTAVDGEMYAVLEHDLQDKEKRIKELETINHNIQVLQKQTELDNDKLKEQVNLMRNSQMAMEIVGRTTQLDHYQLKTTDLVYIKVIHELPYYRLALSMLFNELKERYGTDKVDFVVIKQDEGMDKELYRGWPLITDFNELDGYTRQYRLHPNTTMFTGINKYEDSIDCILVLDFIQNNDYFLDTLARKSVMTMVRYPQDVKDSRLGLEGSPLSIGPGSIYNLEFDDKIYRAQIRETRHNMVRNKVRDWASRLNIKPRSEDLY